MQASDDFSETYDIFTSSDDYASRFFGPTGEWFLKVQEEATEKMIGAYGKCDVLYVGGGHGQAMDMLLRHGCNVTVFSSSESCKKRIQSYVDSGRIRFEVGDILTMPFPKQSFDIVICYRMTAHIVRFEEYLEGLARVAKRAVLVDYPETRSINCVASQMYGIKKRLEPNTRRFKCYRERDLIDVFREAGFRRSASFRQYFIPMMFHRVLKSPKLSDGLERFFRSTGLTSLLGSPVILKVERIEAQPAQKS